MGDFKFETVNVFTDTRFSGNTLTVFPDAAGMEGLALQPLVSELNFSEATFVVPPEFSYNTALVFNHHRVASTTFGIHPLLGTAFLLARLGRAKGELMRFEWEGDLAVVRLLREAGEVVGAEVEAPQPLVIGELCDSYRLREALGLESDDFVRARHLPQRASVGLEFVLAEVEEAALARPDPDLAACRELARSMGIFAGQLRIFLYCRPEGRPLRARMFAPFSGIWEDPATGSAHAALAGLLLSLGREKELAYEAVQGEELGRPSTLRLRAWRDKSKIRVSVGGKCVRVLSGTVAF
jgi:trans-2,3-dihydro-3-hydroxyanthranilate isomerase